MQQSGIMFLSFIEQIVIKFVSQNFVHCETQEFSTSTLPNVSIPKFEFSHALGKTFLFWHFLDMVSHPLDASSSSYLHILYFDDIEDTSLNFHKLLKKIISNMNKVRYS